jgi:thiosulfate/3-mercaptopyruvate sulfurtransferase
MSLFSKNAPQSGLVQVEWLRKNLKSKDIRILDVRDTFGQATAGYPWGHIPGAFPFNPDAFFTLPPHRNVRLLDDLRRELEPLGFARGLRFVIYDESTRTSSTLTYWMLKTLGFGDVSVLDGGWQGWLYSGSPVEDSMPRFPAPAFDASVQDSLLATTDFVLDNLGRIKLIDARTEREYASGHIPGAVWWPWTDNIRRDSESEWLAPRDLLMHKAQEAVGLGEDDEIVCYCNTGGQASHVCFVLDLLGFSRVRLYIGSWDEWRARGLPVER